MATIEELISALLPLLPEAEVRIDASGEIGAGNPGETDNSHPHHTQGDRLTSSRESRMPVPGVRRSRIKKSGEVSRAATYLQAWNCVWRETGLPTAD